MTARRAVIFDMDGVLVLTVQAHFAAWSAVAGAHGIPFDRERFLALNGRTNPDICAALFGERTTPDLVAAVSEHKEAAFRESIRHAVPLAPGLAEVLAAVRARGAAIALGSSAPVANVDAILDGGGLRGWFDAIVHGDMVERGKPAPDVFLRAAELVGCAPDRCVVVEDAPSGVRAALAAGMSVVALTSNHEPGELEAAGAHRIAESLAELPVDWLAPETAGA